MFNVVILAAGYATRLYPLTENFPKPLLKVAGKPIINFLTDSLKPLSKEVGKLVCVTNDKYAGHFEKWKDELDVSFPVEIVNDGTRTNETRLGAIRDVELAFERFEKEEDLMVIAGDNIFDFDLAAFHKKSVTRPEGVSLACTDVKDRELAKRYGILELGEANKVRRFYEKPQDPPSTIASTGIYYFPKKTLGLFSQFLKEKGNNPDAPGFYIKWLVGKIAVYGESLEGVWYDIGDMNSLKEADKVFMKLEGERKV